MNVFKATLPDGRLVFRQSESHTYTHAVAIQYRGGGPWEALAWSGKLALAQQRANRVNLDGRHKAVVVEAASSSAKERRENTPEMVKLRGVMPDGRQILHKVWPHNAPGITHFVATKQGGGESDTETWYTHFNGTEEACAKHAQSGREIWGYDSQVIAYERVETEVM